MAFFLHAGDALPASNAEALAFFTGGGFRFVGFETGGTPPFDSGTHELLGTARIVPGPPEPIPEPGTLLLVATALAVAKGRSGQIKP